MATKVDNGRQRQRGGTRDGPPRRHAAPAAAGRRHAAGKEGVYSAAERAGGENRGPGVAAVLRRGLHRLRYIIGLDRDIARMSRYSHSR
eukprot:2575107-Pleurochrysis_carterae.AAC.1